MPLTCLPRPRFTVMDGPKTPYSHSTPLARLRMCPRCRAVRRASAGVLCGTQVIAKKGKQTAWHFAHASQADCSGAAETALHKAFKQVLLEGQSLRLPDLVAEASASVRTHVGHGSRRINGRAVSYVEPRLEVRMGDIVADAVVTVDGRELIVEIAVEHPVDDDKLKKASQHASARDRTRGLDAGWSSRLGKNSSLR